MKVSKARISYSRVEINSGSMLNFGRIIWGLLENPPWMSRSYISFPIELTMVIFQVVMSVFRFFFHPWSLRWILWHNTEFSRGLKPSFIIKQMQKVIIQQRSPDAVRLKTRRCPCGLKDQSYPSTCWAIADCYYWSGSCQFVRCRLSGRSGFWTGITHGCPQFFCPEIWIHEERICFILSCFDCSINDRENI